MVPSTVTGLPGCAPVENYIRPGHDHVRPSRGGANSGPVGCENPDAASVCGHPPRLCGPPVLVDQAVGYLSALQADLIEIAWWSRVMWWLRREGCQNQAHGADLRIPDGASLVSQFAGTR